MISGIFPRTRSWNEIVEVIYVGFVMFTVMELEVSSEMCGASAFFA